MTDWISAFSGSIATLIALYLLGRDQIDRRRRDADAKRGQAARVRLSAPSETGGAGVRGQQFEYAARTKITNDSAETISRVVVTLTIVREDGEVSGDLPHTFTSKRRRLGPNESWEVKTQAQTSWPMGSDPPPVIRDSKATFYDAAGIQWERDEAHQLREVKPAEIARRRTQSRQLPPGPGEQF